MSSKNSKREEENSVVETADGTETIDAAEGGPPVATEEDGGGPDQTDGLAVNG